MRTGGILLLIVLLFSYPDPGLVSAKSADFQAGQHWKYFSSDKVQSVELVVNSFDGQSGWVVVNLHHLGAENISVTNQEAPVHFDRDRYVYHIEFLYSQDGQNDYYDVVVARPRRGMMRCEVYRNGESKMAMGPLPLKLR